MDDRLLDTDHGPVPIRTRATGDRDIGVLVAHGAGAGHDHPWIDAVCTRLASVGLTTWTFDYAYMAAGRRAPDRLPKLEHVHAAVAEDVGDRVGSLILAGKSMGGRVGGHVVAEGRIDAAGLVYLGYPLVPLGRDEARDTSHLATIEAPQLFVSGTRDRMGPLDLLANVASDVPDGRIVEIPDGDHSLVPRKASGRTLDDSLDDAVGAIDDWLRDRLGG